MSDFIKILDDMIISANGRDLTGYAFFCSKDLYCDIKEHKGYPVYFLNIIKEDSIYFTKDYLYFDEKKFYDDITKSIAIELDNSIIDKLDKVL